jgi:hypothetical protein
MASGGITQDSATPNGAKHDDGSDQRPDLETSRRSPHSDAEVSSSQHSSDDELGREIVAGLARMSGSQDGAVQPLHHDMQSPSAGHQQQGADALGSHVPNIHSAEASVVVSASTSQVSAHGATRPQTDQSVWAVHKLLGFRYLTVSPTGWSYHDFRGKDICAPDTVCCA